MYRTQVWPQLGRALQEGDPFVVHWFLRQLVAQEQFGSPSPVLAVVPERYQDPAVARELLQRMDLHDRTSVALAASPGDPRPEATTLADQWTDELFGGRLPGDRITIMEPSAPTPATSSCVDPKRYIGGR